MTLDFMTRSTKQGQRLVYPENFLGPLGFFGGCKEGKAPIATNPEMDTTSCVAPEKKTLEQQNEMIKVHEREIEVEKECVGAELLSQYHPPEGTQSYPIIFKFLISGSQKKENEFEEDVEKVLQTINHAFAPANIQFYKKAMLVQENSCGLIFTDSTLQDYFEEGGINIIIQKWAPPGGSVAPSGLAEEAGGFLFLGDIDCEMPIAVHEMGHVFGLLHTHGEAYIGNPERDYPSQELVNGSNAEETGDRIADTAADPGPAANDAGDVKGCFVDYDECRIKSCGQDANGQEYHPDVRNYMSYYQGNCRNHFSEQQIQRMLCFADRSPLLNKILRGK